MISRPLLGIVPGEIVVAAAVAAQADPEAVVVDIHTAVGRAFVDALVGPGRNAAGYFGCCKKT